MTAITEVSLIAGREIRKNLRSVKGLVMVLLSLLGAVAVSLLRIKIDKMAAAEVGVEQLHAMQEAVLTKKYDDAAMGKYLADAPAVLLGMLFMTVWLGPLLVAVIGFDSVPSDLQHRAVRYWTVRARRASYYVGKVLGLWAVVAVTTLLMHALIWIVCMAQGGGGLGGSELPSAVLAWGVRFYLVTVPISAAWCGIATLVASQFRNPIVALFVTCMTFFVLWLGYLIGDFGKIKALTYLYPNTYDAWLLSPRADQIAIGVAICLAFAVATTALGSFFFTKRDV